MTRDLRNRFSAIVVSLSLILTGVIYSGFVGETTVKADGTTYYVSWSQGNDNNPGTINSPWKTLSKVSSITFNGGDHVLLKCGDTWTNDYLNLHATGASSTNWVTLSSYGDTSLGKPKILPGSTFDACILIQNINNSDRNCGWKISGLEVGNSKLGIASLDFRSSHDQELDGLWIESCYIHDIYGLDTEGLWMTPYSSAILTNSAVGGQAHNLTIDDVRIENCSQGLDIRWFNSFQINSVYAAHMDNSALNLVTAFNGIIDGCTFLYCGQVENSKGTCGVGFMHSVVNVILQNSEIAYTVSPNHSVDGCGVDYEGASTNVTTRNCNIHDNAGRAFLVMSTGGDCEQSNIYNNICKNNGWDSDPEVEPAFLLLFYNAANGGVISGNVITKEYPGQAVTREGGTYKDTFDFSGFTCMNNTVYESDQSTMVSGSAFGTTPSFSIGSEYDKASDGSTSTYFDYSAANGGYTGIDLGANNAKVITKIRFSPRANFAARMVGGKFQGSNTSSSSGFTDLCTINLIPSPVWNEVAVQDTTAYRYLRYIGPDGSFCNIGEMQFFSDTATPPTWTTADDFDSAIQYSGSWAGSGTAGDYLNATMHYSNTVNDSVQFSFTGSAIRWIGALNNDHGSAQVYIDDMNTPVATVNSYHPSWVTQQVLYQNTALAYGNHTIKIVLSTGGYADVDAFQYISQAPTQQWTATDDFNSSIQYSGSWVGSSPADGYANSTVHYSYNVGNYVQYSFTGSGIRWIGALNLDHGYAQVYIDDMNTPVATINTYNANWIKQQVLYENTSLAYGNHTIRIVISTNGYTDVDAFQYYG